MLRLCKNYIQLDIYILILIVNYIHLVSPTGSPDSCVKLNATQDTQFIYSHDGYVTGQFYQSNTDKCWLIHADPDIFTEHVLIRLTIETLNIENSPDCELDYLDIYYNNTSESPRVQRHCGVQYSLPYNNFASYFTYLHFVSDTSKESLGFKIHYKAERFVNGTYRPVLVNGCEYLEATRQEQTFYSHYSYGASTYPSGYDACWIIHVSPAVPPSTYYGTTNTVYISSSEFSLEPDVNCNLDFMTVYNGNTSDESGEIAKFCGSGSVTAAAVGPYMYVQFVSDKSEPYSGFAMTYTAALTDSDNNTLQLANGCTYLEATHQKQYFTSHPSFGSSDYDSNYFACWIIFVVTNRPNDVVQLSKKNFRLEGKSYGECGDDYMKVVSGTDGYGDGLGTFCGTGFHNTASSGKYMYIHIVTDSFDNYDGFKLIYYAVDRDDAIFGFQFPGWGIALIVIGILLLITAITLLIVWLNWDDIKTHWASRTYCRPTCECNVKEWCSKLKPSKDDDIPVETNQIELSGACAMAAENTETTSGANNTSRTATITVNEAETTDGTQRRKRKKKRRKKQIEENYKPNNNISDEDDETGANKPKSPQTDIDFTNPRRRDQIFSVNRHGISDSPGGDFEISPPPYNSDLDVPPPPYPESDMEEYRSHYV